MPFYTFHCDGCGHEEENFLSIAQYEISGDKQMCPACETVMRRAFDGVPAVHGTDSSYYRARGPLINQFKNRHDLNVRLAQAKKRGFTPGINDVYEPGLAKFPGDPAAWISGGQGQIKKRVAEMADDRGPAPTRLAESIVRKKAKEMIAENPGLAKLPRGELRNQIIEKHGAKA